MCQFIMGLVSAVCTYFWSNYKGTSFALDMSVIVACIVSVW